MTQGGLISVSEAQHEELVTGGDAYGSPGIVEDVTEFGEFGTTETETTAEVTSSADTTSSSDGSESTTKKTALVALGAMAIGAIALGGTN